MIVTYSLPKFKDLILAGKKIHTLRRDEKNRWKTGMKMHHWMHNPRNVSKNPHCFLENECISIEEVVIHHDPFGNLSVNIDGLPEMHSTDVEQLIENDGLTRKEFIDWFVPNIGDLWTGKILHWTEESYGSRLPF